MERTCLVCKKTEKISAKLSVVRYETDLNVGIQVKAGTCEKCVSKLKNAAYNGAKKKLKELSDAIQTTG